MAYTKQTWIDSQSPLNAERMNHIEDGIYQNAEDAAKITEDVNKLSEEIGGGGAHQQFVTDGEGNTKWEEKPFYTFARKIEKLFKNLVWTDNVQAVLDGFSLVEGKAYTVIYNGQEYAAPAVFDEVTGILSITLLGAFDDEENEYIGIVKFPESEIVFLLHGGATAPLGNEITIRYWEEEVKTLEIKYLPATSIVVYDGIDEATCNVDYETFGTMLLAGAPIVLVNTFDRKSTSRVTAWYDEENSRYCIYGNYDKRYSEGDYVVIFFSADGLEFEPQ